MQLEIAHHVELGDRPPSSGSITCSSALRTSSRSSPCGERSAWVPASAGSRIAVHARRNRSPDGLAFTPKAGPASGGAHHRMRVPRAARRTRRMPRSVWVLPTLAFVCGGLVSAAVFTIGWRHQTQQNVAAQTALADATARNHKLEPDLARRDTRCGCARAAARQPTAAARLSQARSASRRHDRGAASRRRRRTVPSPATASAMARPPRKIASELKTSTAYLTTTPPQQLDAGYIDSQAAYLARQVDALQSATRDDHSLRSASSTPLSESSAGRSRSAAPAESGIAYLWCSKSRASLSR